MCRIMKWKKTLRLKNVTGSSVLIILAPLAGAQSWIGTNGANWNVGANWSGGAVPVSGSPAIQNGTHAIINSPAPDCISTGYLAIKYPGSGLAVQSGGSFLMTGQIQIFGESDGVTVSGGSLTASNRVYIGKDGNTNMAVMNVTSGSFTAQNTFEIGGETTAGRFVNGTLNISGGTVTATSTSALQIGKGTNSNVGIIHLTDGTFSNACTATRLGDDGKGYLNQSGGTFISSTAVNLGYSAGGVGTINFSGGTFRALSIVDFNASASGRIGITGNAAGSSFTIGQLVLDNAASSMAFTISKANGITPITVTNAAANSAKIMNGKLELAGSGSFTAADCGRTWDLIHWTGGTIITTGLTMTNTSSAVFSYAVVSDGSGGSKLQATLVKGSSKINFILLSGLFSNVPSRLKTVSSVCGSDRVASVRTGIIEGV